ncbi:MAG: outer membrane beta-barrel protein [Acidobacteriales bacterium]|nr:outer membrane beta-barrel protein [Terriglobales bacterium]
MVRRADIVLAALIAVVIGSASAQAQRFALAANYGGALSKSSSGDNITLSPTQAGTFLGSGQARIASKLAIQINYGRTLNSQIYQNGAFNFRVQGTITEYSGALVFTPWSAKGRIEPFFDAGAGALRFYPKFTFVNTTAIPIGAATQTRPTFTYGAGIDYRLLHGFSFRLQYRGLFYSAPNYNVAQLTTSSYGHVAEPTVGIVFKF